MKDDIFKWQVVIYLSIITGILIASAISAHASTIESDTHYRYDNAQAKCNTQSKCIKKCNQNECPADHDELVGYDTRWGKGEVNCRVTKYGRIYKCTIVRPCMAKGENPCG